MIVVLLLILLLILTYYKLINPYFYWKVKGVPYVKPWPVVGNLSDIVLRTNSFMEAVDNLYKAGRGKRYIGVYNFMEPVLLIRDIDLIKQITVKDFDTFPNHKPLLSSGDDEMSKKHIGNLKREEGWQNMRSTLSPSFTSSKMKILFVLMSKCADQTVDYLKKKGNFAKVNVKDTFSRAANDIIASTAFGVELNSLEDRNNEFFVRGKHISDFSGIKSLLLFLSTSIFAKLFNLRLFDAADSTFFHDLIINSIKYRKEKKIVRHDILHLLMEAQKGQLEYDQQENVIDAGYAVVQESKLGKAKKNIKTKFDDDDITAQIMIFFFAGFEAMSTTLCFVMYELACHPELQEKLYEEICETLEDDNDDVQYDQLLSMKYLDRLISETLRLHGGLPFTDRKSVKPYTIEPKLPGESPVHLPTGSVIWVSANSIHQDPEHFSEPKKFDPERFNDENKHNIKPFTYIPFGTGPRNCIGSRYALLQLKIFTFKLVQHFEIVPIEKTPIPFQYPKGTFTVLPKEGMWLGLKKREDVTSC